jgi:hypothetical protein
MTGNPPRADVLVMQSVRPRTERPVSLDARPARRGA